MLSFNDLKKELENLGKDICLFTKKNGGITIRNLFVVDDELKLETYEGITKSDIELEMALAKEGQTEAETIDVLLAYSNLYCLTEQDEKLELEESLKIFNINDINDINVLPKENYYKTLINFLDEDSDELLFIGIY